MPKLGKTKTKNNETQTLQIKQKTNKKAPKLKVDHRAE